MYLQPAKRFENLLVTVQKHSIAYCRCRGCKAIWVPADTVQPDRDLQQCAELHFSLIGRDEGHIKLCIISGGQSITKFEKLCINQYKIMNIHSLKFQNSRDCLLINFFPIMHKKELQLTFCKLSVVN
jgi:hypothetical protein